MKTMKRPTQQLLLLLSLALFLAGAAQARPAWKQEASYRYAAQSSERSGSRQQGKSLDAAVAQVRRETGGRILSAETVSRQGRRVHRIKVLTPDNRVRIVNIDAGS